MKDQRAPVAVFLIERLQDINLDEAFLEGGGSVNYLPPSEQDKAAEPAPAPVIEPAPAPREEPKPTRVDDTPAPREEPKDEPKDDDPPPLDDDAPALDDDDAPKPRRRPRRVSRVSPFGTVEGTGELAWSSKVEASAPRERTTRLGSRGPARQSTTATEEVKQGAPGEVLTGGKAISAALTYGDKRVRYAAAIALAHLNPVKEFANSEKVVENLVDALGESGQRVVLVVERDRSNRNRIVGLLRELGYMAFGVESGRDGLVRAKSFPGQDLIIVGSELNPDGDGGEPIEVQFIDDLRDDYRTKPVKVMILTPEDRVDTMKSLVDQERAIDVITPQIDKATLSDKLNQAFGSPEDQRDEKARSDKIAERAALAIASHSVKHTRFKIVTAAGALAKNVRRDTGRPDAVRLACLHGLAAVGPEGKGAALETLIREFQDDTNSIEVRRAIPLAVGELIKGAPVSGDTFQVLKNALKDSDAELVTNAGRALGKGKLTGEQAREVYEEQRLE